MAMPAPESPAPKAKTTVYMDREVLCVAKVLAAATGRSESQLIEDAVRGYIRRDPEAAGKDLIALLTRIRNVAPPISDKDALALAYDELDAMRSERDA